MTIIPIVIGTFGTVTKGLWKGLEDLEAGGWVETIQTTTLSLNCCHSNSSERPSTKADMKNSQGVNNNNNNNNTCYYIHE